MSAQCEVTVKQAACAPMSVFERYLTVWVFLCIVVGIVLGQWMPGVFQAIGQMEVAKVNLPVGLLIWIMIILFALVRGLIIVLFEHRDAGVPLQGTDEALRPRDLRVAR